MKQRKAKRRKAAAKGVGPEADERLSDKVLDALMDAAVARIRREEDAKHEREMRELNAAVKAAQDRLPKRELSQLKFTEQHWWGDGQIFKRYKKDGKIQRKMSVDHAKAALIYEGMRRRTEVQQAWLNGEFDARKKGWQEFVGMVIQYLPHSWEALGDMTQQTFVNRMQSPWFVPPLGYSTFPDKSAPQNCERATIQILPTLGERNGPTEAQNFIHYLKRFEDAGFIFVAIDHKSSQRDKYALNALRKRLGRLPHTARKQDLRLTAEHHLPPGVSAEDRKALEEKAGNGTLTLKDFDELWHKYTKPTSDLFAPWHTTATFHELITGKNKRKTKSGEIAVDEMRFDFPKLFAELANLDNGKIQRSDFVSRLRAG